MKKEFARFKEGEFVFVQDMSDLFAGIVPEEYIQRVMGHIQKFPKTTFLLLTKNPNRYREFEDRIPKILFAVLQWKQTGTKDTTKLVTHHYQQSV